MKKKEISIGNEVFPIDGYGFGLSQKLVAAYRSACDSHHLISENWPQSSLSPVTRLMRFTTVEHLREMIRTRRNFLASVFAWQDVWEGLARNIELKDRNGNHIDISRITTSFYGQCWSLSEFDSELLWNARCSKMAQNGVCIRSTFGKLASSFIEGIGIVALKTNLIARLGAVQYLSDEQFEDKIQSLCSSTFDSAAMNLAGKELLECLMVKRKRFSDEKEVRLIVDYVGVCGKTPDYLATGKFSPALKGLTYSIEPACFLDEIIVDPRISKSKADEIINGLNSDLKVFGWTNCSVRQSDLYDCKSAPITIDI